MSDSQHNPPLTEVATRGKTRRRVQSRGLERIEALLDAAARIIAEDGVAALTMHGIARQASSSIGSLYHFFPDQRAVLEALIARHDTGIDRIRADLASVPDERWQSMSIADALELLIAPYVAYAGQHPDYFPLMHGRRSPAAEASFARVVERMLAARLPALSGTALTSHAVMLHSMAAGTLHVAYMLDPEQMAFYMKEILRAMVAYLADVEREWGG